MRQDKKNNKEQKAGRGLFWPIFFIAVIFVYFFGLTIPLVGPDEPRFAQVAREMFERGDWITPTLGGYDWFEKPALLYWLQIAAYHIFGVSEFSARVGSTIFGLGTIAVLWLLGITTNTKFPTNNDQRSTINFPNLLTLIAASTIGIIVFSRGASFDIIVTFTITASLVSFYIFDQKSSRIPLVFFYFFTGLALLAKGLIGFIFPVVIVSVYFLLSRRLSNKTFVFSILWGTILAILIASVWYLPMYLKHGWKFIDEFFFQHHFQRFTSNKYQHPQPFYFFFWVLPLLTIPWLPFFLASIWQKIFNRRHLPISPSPHLPLSPSPLLPFFPSPLLAFSLSWLLVPLIFFSFSGSKLPGYILPALPAAIILIAAYLFPLVNRSRNWRLAVKSVAAATLIVVVLLLQFIVPGFAKQDSVKHMIETAASRGYSNEKILTLHTISHNAEFYASNRLLRTEDGKQRKLLGVAEIVEYMKMTGESKVLVLVPQGYLHELINSKLFYAEALAENEELVLVKVIP